MIVVHLQRTSIQNNKDGKSYSAYFKDNQETLKLAEFVLNHQLKDLYS